MGRQRIGLVIYGRLSAQSGGYLYDAMLVKALREHGFVVGVFSLPWRSYALHLLDNLRSGFARRIGAAGLHLLLEDELNHPSLLLFNRQLKEHGRFPIVSIVHHLRSSEQRPGWQKAGYAMVEKSYLRGVDGFVFNSRATADAVHRMVDARQPSVVAYPAGDRFHRKLDDSLIFDRVRRVPPLRIVFLGNVIRRKGLETLIDALALLPRDTWTLTVIGHLTVDPPLAQRLRRRVAALGLIARIELTGRLADEQVADVLRAAHVLVVPSTYEGYGIAYLEGMAFGLPAIGTTHGGGSEIITDRVDGRLLPSDDPLALSVALEELIGNPATLNAMSQAALERSRAHPTWAESMGKAVNFLENLM